jgi:multidrug resistance efflux pump
MADLGLKGQMDSLRDARDELAQLEKMYAGTSLQSETKDIVLDRARRGVERSETYSKYAKRDNEIFKAIRHPNEARRVEDAAKDAALALEAASLGQRLGEIRETLDMAQAERGLRDLERRLERMEGDGRRMTVKSPSDGYLVVKLRDVGAQLQPRQELAEVVDLGRLRVRGTLNADAMRFAKVGDVVDVWFPARPEVAAKAEIDEVVAVGAPEGEGASFAFTATLREPDASLLPGIEARVLVRANLADRLTVPSKALSQSKGRFTVKVMKDGATAEREVRVGASDGTRTEVIAGLEAGDAVVVTEG